ncbi:MAG: hypothetical protein ACUVXB_08340 [Bryobacteraceae bacterium]
MCLHAVALRAARQKSGVHIYPSAVKLLYDSVSMKITNAAGTNDYLSRDYRRDGNCEGIQTIGEDYAFC